MSAEQFESTRKEFDAVAKKLRTCKDPVDRLNLLRVLRHLLTELERFVVKSDGSRNVTNL